MKNKNDVSKISVTDRSVVMEFNDGAIGEEFFSSYPRLNKASKEKRLGFILSYFGIHWPELDEDLSFEGFYKKAKRFPASSL